ncbi:uncharacterized protein LAJ45_08413 [Morchella importuna]|uniref:uncharacterized protein n=1 Tax=Morchella importuna TaxID=1174673 RepID=UPI001E8D1444|nr:uncharacterized protein LAJ45_08413 [Morchella importuna]KAH8147585.1 hypothetical protein LAJ45_08413 [Morchella importuna]
MVPRFRLQGVASAVSVTYSYDVKPPLPFFGRHPHVETLGTNVTFLKTFRKLHKKIHRHYAHSCWRILKPNDHYTTPQESFSCKN